MSRVKDNADLQQFEQLQLDYRQARERLQVAEETLYAIRRGEVEALVAHTPAGVKLVPLVEVAEQAADRERAQAAAVAQVKPPVHLSTAAGLGVAVLCVALALGLRWLFWPILGSAIPLLFMWPCVMVAAWYGGFWAGVAASLLSTAGVAFFILEPRWSFAIAQPAEQFAVVFFLALGAVLSWLCEKTLRTTSARLTAEAERHALQFADEYNRGLIARLAQTSNRFRIIFEEAPLGIALIDSLTGQFYEVNPRFAAIAGRSREEMTCIDWMSITHPDDVQADLDNMAALNAGKIPGFTMQKRYIRPDGSIVWINMTIAPVSVQDRAQPRHLCMIEDITERRKIEQELRTSEDNLRRAQAVAHVGSWRLDIPRNQLTWTEENYRVFGVPPGTPMTYNKFLELVHPEDRAFVDQQWTAALNGAPYDIEHRIQVDGRVRWVREKAEVQFGPDGAALRGIGITHDISDRKKADDELRRSELRFRTLVLATSQIVWTTDPAGLVHEDLPSWRAYTGQSYDEIQGSGWSEALHPDDRAPTLAVWQKACAERTLYETEYRIRGRDGEYHEVVARGAPVLDAQGNVREWIGTCTDISARKQAEREVRKVNRALRALSHCNEALIRASSETELLDSVCRVVVEEAGYRMCWVGFPEQDDRRSVRPAACAGAEAEYLAQADIRWSDSERGQGPTGTALRTGQAVVANDIATDPSMAPWRAEALRRGFHSCVALPLKEGERVIGMMSIYAGEANAFSQEELRLLGELVDDLAFGLSALRVREERRRAEESVRRLNVELEERVEERTADLRAANKELEAFAYSVSHDLRAPLRAIDGFSQILLTEHAEALSEKPRHYLKLVCDNTRKMGQLIDDLLRFSRIGRQSLHIQRVETAALVQQCLQDLEPEYAGRHVEVQVGDLPECQADAALLKQVWLNLLSNAFKFTRPRDPARVEVGAVVAGEGQAAAGETVFFVRDNGVGFDMQYADKLFGVFQRLHSAEEFEGTGIGLALVQRILHRHGGRIWAEAKPDQGATFYFTLGREPAHD